MKFIRNLYQLKFIAFLFLFSSVSAQVRLPKLISDGMVLQREADVKIWGWATAAEKIEVHFNDSLYQTTTTDSGIWEVNLAKMQAGGPYSMVIKGSNTITISNILVGDVWLCSGQSNMELSMKRVSPLYESEIVNSTNINIRYFAVPKKYNFKEAQSGLEYGNWKAANPESVLEFSAVAYFYAKELYQKYQIPIGLINSSLGGSPAEAWISESSLKQFPEYYAEAQKFKDNDLIDEIIKNDQSRIQSWYNQLRKKDQGYQKMGQTWHDPFLDTEDWETMNIPGYWASTGLGAVNGVVWFKKVVDVPATMVEKPVKLLLGRIVDADSVFVNGTFVGTTSYQYPPRRYTILSGILKEGKNTIVIRVINNSGQGGFVMDKPYAMLADGQTVDLKGEWQYRLGAKMEPLASQTFIRWKPLGLYNAMISPLLNYRIKGVIWYQGESNADKPLEYCELFSCMIEDWREKWQQGNFPFLFVQLANFMETKNYPAESNWAMLRNAQLKTLKLPNTGMAVITDIGEWNDIHPLNKEDVGKRLALAAQKVAYGDKQVVYSGPSYQSMSVEGNRAILSFTNLGSGLVAKGGIELKHFAIAGENNQFVWAKAEIVNNQVVVSSEKVSHPVAVRYAWSDNPEAANLYNKEGLPASPFRTDD